MEELIEIPKNKHLPADQDYQWLRKKGLEYIESLGSDVWTDYNVHDPGITIMEALCYAITELGYRASFEVKDLLTDANGKISDGQAFYTARNILTCNPTTINDYRKLLVDIKGIHNAWLVAEDFTKGVDGNKKPLNEVPLFADCKADAISVKTTNHPLFLSGLYKVLLDLDNDDQFGDLNKGDIEIANPPSSGDEPKYNAGEIIFTIELPHANKANKDFVQAAANEERINNISITQKAGKWKVTVSTDTAGAFAFMATINLKPHNKTVDEADLIDFFKPKYLAQIFHLYRLKLEKIEAILIQARKVLHQSRNLCEDFMKIETVTDEEVAICCDVDVRPDADMEKIQAEVFYLIENYLNPSVRFYLLKELFENGKTADEIFEGPRLAHGFIDTDELEKTNLREIVYTSDIINLLMDIPGVLAVRNFMLTKYDDEGNAIKKETGLKWCMKISKKHKPVLSLNRSKIVFFKNNFPFAASYGEVRDSLKLLRAGKERPKLKGHHDDLAVPVGRFHKLNEYVSIQNDLPKTYGVGEAGVGFVATDERKAQAKQLKAYLLFFDQLLANFFSQLANTKNLFSLEPIKQTYFTQHLQNIPHIKGIYRENPVGNELIKQVFANQDSTVSSINTEWKKLVENELVFEDRRNRFLDHLLARFGESFNDYVLMMYKVDQKNKTANSLTAEELLASKTAFLKEYPVISYERGKAFNYVPLNDAGTIENAKFWNTDNVSGLDKRAAKLSGVKNYFRRFLSCIKNIEIQTVHDKVIADGIELVKTHYQFILKSRNGDALIQNGRYENREEFEKLIQHLPNLFDDKANYLYDAGSKKIEVINEESKVVAISDTTYASKAEADKTIKQFETEFKEGCDDAEGMLLIEHILLRPRDKSYELLPVCLSKDCAFCGEEDPYSFRASIILPYWPEKFSGVNFKTYFEHMIRQEAPAHLMIKICWVDNTQMRELELVYKSWVTALGNHSLLFSDVHAAQLKSANDSLVKLLPTLHTIYPEATLHDCDESENVNPVMLGKTILGTQKHKHNE